MPWEAWATIAVVALVLVGLVRNLAGPDVVLLGGLTILMTLGAVSGSDRLLSPRDMVAGFGNEGLITVAVLFVVAAGLTQTGAMSMVAQPLLGRPRSMGAAQARLMLPVATLSAFLNNTPIVAMFMPVVSDWCKRSALSPAKLFIPLSYAAILGGMCTLIGTSTNLVVFGMVQDAIRGGALTGVHLGMFTIAAVGVPAAVVGIIYVLLVSRRLLPETQTPGIDEAQARRYTIEMLVEPNSPIDGRTIEQAGLRHLRGLFLAEIERQGERLVAVGPEERLRGGDRLIFVGVVDSIVDLQRIRGLAPATSQVFKLRDPRPNRCLVEAVVSPDNPLVGQSIREGRFRTVYNAVVIAVHRGRHHVSDKKIGDIVLRAGDTLLMEAHPRFVDNYRNSRDFFLVSAVADSAPIRHEKAWLALAILAAMVAAVTVGWLSMVNAALLAAGLMVLTRCCSPTEARNSVDWRLLLVIGAALGIGQTLRTSGAAGAISHAIINLAGGNPWLVLLAVYLVTNVFTELITNNAAAVLVFPIAQSAAQNLGEGGVNFTGFVIAIMIAASASFATPIGYQTNLMVYGAGGYRFSDYVRIGLPLNLLIMAIVVGLAPLIWPF